ncbi:hypothetical protein STVIR_0147 [Streptomyces viridochromogenes Tue57]|uniref:Transmembrane protein n=2 Tax=Streptomyces viridochromogenes TaxID=1938 RepID=L8PS33_STRVR|nr:hypothetical protein STVIR_0147 [Streptomyces viridochromogenes Tue57]
MMNSVPQHLLSEDRREYERILDEALRSAPHRPELAAAGQRLNPEQLRTMALNATALITAAAATEYQHYVRVREELRRPAPSTPSCGREPGSAGSRAGAGAMGPAAGREEAAHVLPGPVAVVFSRVLMAVLGFGRRGGRGTKPTQRQQRRMPFGRRLLAALLGVRTRPVVSRVTRAEAAEQLAGKLSRSARTLSVLAGFLGVLATLLCLLVGYVLKEFGAAASTAQALVTTGWILAVATTIPILPAIVGVVLTARRNRSDFEDGPYGELSEEVARAREAWLEALLERGILPFLRDALADPGTTSALHRTPPPTPTGRISNLGYDRPGFSSPDDGPPAGPRPSFTSQDFRGPEHRSE